MKCFGYDKNNEDELLDMSEITLQTNSDMLRKLASFLVKCADEIESIQDWEHEHFCDYLKDGEDVIDVVVFNDKNIN